MDPQQIRPGDLLLVTRIPGEPLGELMQRLDGTVFSHSGIAVRPDQDPDRPATHLLSALAKDLPGDVGYDLGGVRWDAFASFRPHRDLYCIPMPDDLRARALGYVARFEPTAGKEGTFSFVKLVTVAAALRAVELRTIDPALAVAVFDATSAVAETLGADRHGPSYYCAELVANAYGRRFTRAEMLPPVGSGYGLGDGIEEPDWFAELMRLFDDEIAGIADPEWRAATELLGVLVKEDWDFLAHAVRAVTRSAVAATRDVVGVALVPEPLGVPPREPGPDEPIPHALVTPRMLWAAFGQGTLRKVAQPGHA